MQQTAREMMPAPIHAVNEKTVGEQGLPGGLSSGSSAIVIVKDGPPDGGLEAWLQVLGAFLMYFNTWGNSANLPCIVCIIWKNPRTDASRSQGIVSSYGSYQTWYEDSILSTSSSFQVSTIGALQSFFMVFLGFLAGPIFDKGHFKLLVRSGSVLMILGTITQGLSSRYWQLLLSQGVCVGLGMGCLAVPSVAVPSAWFTTRLSLANGIIVSASGFGGSVSPCVFRAPFS